MGREWEAGYSGAGQIWWMYGGLVVIGLASWGMTAAGIDLGGGGTAGLAWFGLIAVGVVAATRLMLPRKGRLVLDGGVLRIERGKRVTLLRRRELRADAQQWGVAPGHEIGTALRLSDGIQSITLGLRDCRIEGADGRCHSPDAWIESTAADELLPLLELDLDVTNADAPLKTPTRPRTITLLRNSNRFWPVATMIGGMFGGMILTGVLAFSLEAWLQRDMSWVMMLMLPAIFGSMILHMTYARRGKVIIATDGPHISITRAGTTNTWTVEELALTPCHVENAARGYGEYQTPTLTITPPNADPITVGTADIRLRWSASARRRSQPPFITAPLDFRLLVGALGLADQLTVDREIEQQKLARLAGRRR